MTDDDEILSYSSKTFAFDADSYDWPRISRDGGATELNVHCIRDPTSSEFILMGFIDVDRETQINSVIYMAQLRGAEVIMFTGVGLTDDMLDTLVTCRPPEFINKNMQISMMHVKWPTRFQRKILREAYDMGRYGEAGEFHESSLAYRLKASVEEIHHHLEVLADLGLMEAMR